MAYEEYEGKQEKERLEKKAQLASLSNEAIANNHKNPAK